MSEAVDTVNGRESTYGHPWDDFTTIREMYKVWERRYASTHTTGIETAYDECVKHAVYMTIVKLVRLSKATTHRDSILDLGGYAETLMRCYNRASEGPKPIQEFQYGGPVEGIPTAMFAKVPLEEMRHRIMMEQRGCLPGDTFIGDQSTEAFERPSDEEIDKALQKMMDKVPMDLPDPGDSFVVKFNKPSRVPGDTFIGGPNAEEAAKPPLTTLDQIRLARGFEGIAPTPP